MSKYFLLLNNKKYPYTLKVIDKKMVLFHCEAAKISQPFLKEDIPNLLIDLPHLISVEKRRRDEPKQVIRFRVTQEDKQLIEQKAVLAGYDNVSTFLRELALKVA